MFAPTIGIGIHLAFEIAGIEPGEARCARPVSAAVKAVAGEAGTGRAGIGAAQGDDATIRGEAVMRRRVERASAEKEGEDRGKRRTGHGGATDRPRRLFPLGVIAPLSLLGACQPPPDQLQFMPLANAASGKAAMERVGCGSCHVIPGIDWPQGAVGPRLDALPTRALIGGALPNRPDALAAYIRNAPALVPGTAMPAMPVSAQEARDMAAYLYEQGAD